MISLGHLSLGIRRGELLALRFEDVDWFQNELIINKSVARFPATDGDSQVGLEDRTDEVKEVLTGEWL